MSVVECPNCEKTVVKTHQHCPYCDFPIKAYFDRQRDIYFYSIIGAFVALLVALFLFFQGSIISGIFVFVASVFILPLTKDALDERLVIPRFFWNVVVVLCLFGGLKFFNFNEDATPVNVTEPIPSEQNQPKANNLENSTQTTDVQYVPVQATPAKTTYDETCKIVAVSDGDTATCLTDSKKQIKIRLDQIDAPEKGQPFGETAKQALSLLAFQKTVQLKINGQDKYGRTVVEVFEQGNNVNKRMVSLGMAWAYREYIRDNEYIELEAQARNANLGIWSEPRPIYPSDFRRYQRGEQMQHTQTQQINEGVNQQSLLSSGGQCGSKRYCTEMTSCSEAKHYLNVCGVSRLDKDGDGVPCESLCQ